MSRQTFEEALRTVLGNSRFAQAIDEEQPGNCCAEAYEQDRKEIEQVFDNLCEDLSKLTGKNIKRFSKLRKWSGPILYETAMRYFSNHVSLFIKEIQYNFQPGRSRELTPIVTYPLSKIWWSKNGAKVEFPVGGEIMDVWMTEPEMKSLDAVDKPSHIQELIYNCQTTHYDYQPYVITGSNGNKVFALKLGCEWHDVAISTWTERNLSVSQTLICCSLFCYFGMASFLYLSTRIESWWMFVTLAIAFIFGIFGVLQTTLLWALSYKPLKL